MEAVGIDKIREEKQLSNLILYLIGEECLDVYMTPKDGDDYESVIKSLDEYFIPSCIIRTSYFGENLSFCNSLLKYKKSNQKKKDSKF